MKKKKVPQSIIMVPVLHDWTFQPRYSRSNNLIHNFSNFTLLLYSGMLYINILLLYGKICQIICFNYKWHLYACSRPQPLLWTEPFICGLTMFYGFFICNNGYFWCFWFYSLLESVLHQYCTYDFTGRKYQQLRRGKREMWEMCKLKATDPIQQGFV